MAKFLVPEGEKKLLEFRFKLMLKRDVGETDYYSNILCHKYILRRFLQKLAARTNSLIVGNAWSTLGSFICATFSIVDSIDYIVVAVR